MIQDVEFDDSSMNPGERRRMTITGTARITVSIKCFITKPPPPGFKSCPECGTINATSGQPFEVAANSRLFSTSEGTLEIDIKDSEGDARHYSVSVSPISEPTAVPG